MKTNAFVFIASVLFILLVRLFLFSYYQPQLYEGEHITLKTTLLADPSSQGSRKTFSVRYYATLSSTEFQVIVPHASLLHYGETAWVSGVMSVKIDSKTKKSILVMDNPHVKIYRDMNFILALSYYLRQKTAEMYRNFLPATSSGLLLGVVLGIKANMPKSFMDNLRSVGLVHVIAASGMNVTMVASFLSSFLSRFTNRRIGLIINTLTIAFYAILSGLQPSIVRASVMTIMVFNAQLIGRQYTALYSLFFTSILMLFIQPEMLTNIGFQLSVLSTIGILTIKPLIPPVIFISDDIGTTISAQLATIPILLSSFGQYGLLSVLVNGLVLWMVPLLMVFGGVGGMIGLLLPSVGGLLIFLCLPFLFFFEKIVTFFGSLQWNISMKSFPVIAVFVYYFVLSLVIVFIKKKWHK